MRIPSAACTHQRGAKGNIFNRFFAQFSIVFTLTAFPVSALLCLAANMHILALNITSAPGKAPGIPQWRSRRNNAPLSQSNDPNPGQPGYDRASTSQPFTGTTARLPPANPVIANITPATGVKNAVSIRRS
jgi:hypothetical protein